VRHCMTWYYQCARNFCAISIQMSNELDIIGYRVFAHIAHRSVISRIEHQRLPCMPQRQRCLPFSCDVTELRNADAALSNRATLICRKASWRRACAKAAVCCTRPPPYSSPFQEEERVCGTRGVSSQATRVPLAPPSP
jgi:hypothetical protein